MTQVVTTDNLIQTGTKLKAILAERVPLDWEVMVTNVSHMLQDNILTITMISKEVVDIINIEIKMIRCVSEEKSNTSNMARMECGMMTSHPSLY